jgi:hypothetical protein
MRAMRIPAQVRDGDTVVWLDQATVDVFGAPIDASTYQLRYFLRANATGAAETLLGVADSGGWRFTWVVSESVTGPRTYYWQAQAEAIGDGAKVTLGNGSLVIEPSLAYVGSAGAYDGRSQAEKDLEAVQGAIRALLAGGSTKEYKIGSRSLKRYDIAELLQLEGKLKADVAREKQAEMIANGLGNPRNMFVRFNK